MRLPRLCRGTVARTLTVARFVLLPLLGFLLGRWDCVHRQGLLWFLDQWLGSCVAQVVRQQVTLAVVQVLEMGIFALTLIAFSRLVISKRFERRLFKLCAGRSLGLIRSRWMLLLAVSIPAGLILTTSQDLGVFALVYCWIASAVTERGSA